MDAGKFEETRYQLQVLAGLTISIKELPAFIKRIDEVLEQWQAAPSHPDQTKRIQQLTQLREVAQSALNFQRVLIMTSTATG